jgi:hypothetical protein
MPIDQKTTRLGGSSFLHVITPGRRSRGKKTRQGVRPLLGNLLPGKGPHGFALYSTHSSAPGEINQIVWGLQFRGISPQNKTGGFYRV